MDSDSDVSFDDEDAEEAFDMFTGEAMLSDHATFAGEEPASRPTAHPSVSHELYHPGDAHNSWQWVPLKAASQIRLISIDNSADPDAFIRCHMRTTTLDEPCGYLALSYSWGTTYDDDSHLTHIVDCDDAPFRVTKNLHDALLRIRRHWNTAGMHGSSLMLPVWCDAMCIDQKNPVERSTQVMMMDRIYRRATHLLIWLGAEVAEPVDRLVQMAEGLQPSEHRQVGVTHIVSASPWFRRRWVIQESASQPETSTSILSMSGLLSAKTMRVWLGSSDLNDPTDAGALRERGVAPLLAQLHWHRNAHCSDDRDRVYALRSVSLDGKDLVVDYTKSPAETYLAVALLSAKSGNLVPLLILATLYRMPYKRRNTSSWIPDWSSAVTRTVTDVNVESIQAYTDVSCHASAREALDQWADQPDLHNLGTAGEYHIWCEASDDANVWRLRLTGWLFPPCNCSAPNYAEDCLHCLIIRHSYVVDPEWLHSIRQLRLFVFQDSRIVLKLKPAFTSDATHSLTGCTRLPERQDLAGKIGKHWMTESGKMRKLEQIVLV